MIQETLKAPKYLIDGYNLLFYILESKASFDVQRKALISHLQKKFAKLSLKGAVVFDGAHRREEESGLSYKSPLDIVYTPKGQTADAYIVERLSLIKNAKLITVVTNDKGLIRHARAANASVLTNEDFLQFLNKKSKNPKEKSQLKETKYNIDRLLKIFEERLDSSDED